jgi:glucose/arabinose dehydrogenase
MKSIIVWLVTLLLHPILSATAATPDLSDTVVGTSAAPDTDPDTVVDAPLSPEEAAASMIVPKGFNVTLFAGEPDVQQPIGFCFDDRGRLWVAEAYNYPNHGTKPGDRIVIFEDTDGDGKFDKRKVFYDQLNYVTGIEVGFGGAWVMSPPNFYFIPDRDGDDVPDAQPQVLLDGFGNHANSHNLANGFAWGPDGWLYGWWSLSLSSGSARLGTLCGWNNQSVGDRLE